MTREELQETLRLCEDATPGPWSAVQDHLGHWRIVWEKSHNSSVMRRGKAFDEHDARMIAAARMDLPKVIRFALDLMDENERQKKNPAC